LIDAALEKLQAADKIYEKKGRAMVPLTEYGDEKKIVLSSR